MAHSCIVRRGQLALAANAVGGPLLAPTLLAELS